jgi:PKD repeat protein
MKSRRVLFGVVVAIACLCGSAFGADYYVATTGDDAWPGTFEQPWRHMYKAGNTVVAGDTVYLRGGTYSDDWFWPVNSGTASAPITLKAYPGETPTVTGAGYWGVFVYIGWSGNQYFVIDGLHSDNTTGEHVVRFDNSTHCVLKNCHFTNHEYTMVWINRGGYHTVENNYFDTTGSPSAEGSGDHIYVLGSDHNLIQGNYFTRAGHSCVDFIDYLSLTEVSEYNILRNNTMEQHWGSGTGLIRGSSHILVENNKIYYPGEEVTTYPKNGVQVAADDNIVRGNVIAWTSATPFADNGLTFEGYIFSGISQHCRSNCVYNNVIYKAGKEAVFVTQRNDCVVTGNHFLNNILYYCRIAGPYEEWWPDGNYYFIFETYHADPDNKWPEFPNYNYYHHNLMLHADEYGDYPGEDPFMYYDQDAWGHSLAWVQAQFPTYWYANIEQNPGFVNADGGDFHLQSGSAAIDAGDFLTRTTASGSSTTTVPVQEASFFCDGFERVAGDMVKVGSNALVMVTSVDYGANILTVASPISFNANDPVSLPYEGLAPDMGAFEYGGAPPPPVAEFSGNPLSGYVPLTVYFTDLSTGSPTSWDWAFGDGGTSPDQDPSHQYQAADTYTVSLTVENASGQDTETKLDYITVMEQPVLSCHVGAIDMANAGNPKYRARATVTVHDQDCIPLAGVTVAVTWTGAAPGSDAGVTNDSGQVTFTSGRNKSGGTYTCSVDSLTKTGYPYQPGDNHETSDSITLP